MDNNARQKMIRALGATRRAIHIPAVSALLNIGVAMGVYMACRCVFALDNLSMFEGTLSWSAIPKLLKGGALFDLAAILYTNLPYLLITLLPLHWKESGLWQRTARWLFFVVNSAAVVMNLADTAYFPYSFQRSTVALLHQFSNDGNIARIVMLEAVNHWHFFLIGAALIFILWRCYTTPRPDVSRLKRYYIAQSLWLLAAAPLIVCGIRGDWFRKGTRPLSMSDARQYVSDPSLCGIALNTPFTMLRTSIVESVDIPAFYAEVDPAVYTPIHHPADTAVFRKKNVVILIVESFAQEFVGALNTDLDGGRYKGYTPFFDTLLPKGAYFSDTFCNARTSIDAMPAVLASIPKFKASFISSPYSINRFTSIPGLLGPEGYHTAFFHGAHNTSMGFHAFADACGFSEYYGLDEFCADPRTAGMEAFDGTWGIWDEEFLQYFCAKLSEFPEPFMASVFTLSSHHPFNIPDRYRDTFPDEGAYPLHKCIRYADNSLRLFFAEAERQPWFGNTLFIITADHASSKVTHDLYKQGVGDFRIPILIYDPSGGVAPGRRQGIMQQIDILPTLMAILGYGKPYFAYGKDALSVPPSESWSLYFHDQPMLLRGDWALRLDPSEGFAPDGFYNFRSDPLLRRNLLQQPPPELAPMDSMLRSVLQSVYQTMQADNMRI